MVSTRKRASTSRVIRYSNDLVVYLKSAETARKKAQAAAAPSCATRKAWRPNRGSSFTPAT